MNDRLIILEALLLIEKGEDYGGRIIKDVLDKYSYLDRQHRSFIKRVLEGTMERRIELDYIIDQFSKTPTASMKPVILCILRMSVYQLKYMDQIPESAICNEAVKLAEKKGFFKLKGFVNGVLRNIARNLVDIKYPKRPTEINTKAFDKKSTRDAIRYLSVMYSMPTFLVEHFLKYYGPDVEKVENIFKAFFREGITTARPNWSKTTDENLMQSIEADGAKLTKLPDITSYNIKDGISTDLTKSPTAYVLTGYDRLSDLRAFKEGLFTVQDQSAMLPVFLSGIKAGDTVMDVCAAPGGKTIQAIDLLCTLKNPDFNHKIAGGRVFSFDISEYKTELIRENLLRCDFDHKSEELQKNDKYGVEVIVDECDATEFHNDYVNQVDVMIADLPCSGLGIIGRKSDIKYNVTPEGMGLLVKLQREILGNVVKYVKNGGTLMYSTCTLNPEENENQVKWMEDTLGLKCEEMHCILPSEYRDGFFVAKMIK